MILKIEWNGWMSECMLLLCRSLLRRRYGGHEPLHPIGQALLRVCGARLDIPSAVLNLHELEVICDALGVERKLKVLLVRKDEQRHLLERFFLH